MKKWCRSRIQWATIDMNNIRTPLPEARSAAERAWLEGWQAASAGDSEFARAAYRRALADDPTCADALLGLHRLEGGLTLLEQMFALRHDLGAVSGYFGLPLVSGIEVAPGVDLTIADGDDLVVALAMVRTRDGDLRGAESLLAGRAPTSGSDPAGALAAGHLALCQGQPHLAALALQKYQNAPGLGSACALALAEALVARGARYAADALLGRIAARPDAPLSLRLAARYRKAELLEQLAPGAGRGDFELVYLEQADYRDVSLRIMGEGSAREWQLIVEGLGDLSEGA